MKSESIQICEINNNDKGIVNNKNLDKDINEKNKKYRNKEFNKINQKDNTINDINEIIIDKYKYNNKTKVNFINQNIIENNNIISNEGNKNNAKNKSLHEDHNKDNNNYELYEINLIKSMMIIKKIFNILEDSNFVYKFFKQNFFNKLSIDLDN